MKHREDVDAVGILLATLLLTVVFIGMYGWVLGPIFGAMTFAIWFLTHHGVIR